MSSHQNKMSSHQKTTCHAESCAVKQHLQCECKFSCLENRSRERAGTAESLQQVNSGLDWQHHHTQSIQVMESLWQNLKLSSDPSVFRLGSLLQPSLPHLNEQPLDFCLIELRACEMRCENISPAKRLPLQTPLTLELCLPHRWVQVQASLFLHRDIRAEDQGGSSMAQSTSSLLRAPWPGRRQTCSAPTLGCPHTACCHPVLPAVGGLSFHLCSPSGKTFLGEYGKFCLWK